MTKRVRKLIAAAALVIAGLAFDHGILRAQCVETKLCIDLCYGLPPEICTPSPTSLPAVGECPDVNGWTTAGGNCAACIELEVFPVGVCGPPLAASACIG
jgi:hypothetical protein